MSIANLTKPNILDLYAHRLDTTTSSLELGTVDAPRIDIGHDNIPIFINGVPYNSGNTPVVPNTLAFFTGATSSTIDDTDITVFGVQNSLHFTPPGIIESNNYFSSNGTINIGNVLNDTDIFMDASNSIVIGHEGLAVQIVESIITNSVACNSVDRNGTPDPLNIGGTFASAVNLGRVGQNVNVLGNLIADGIDSSNPVGLFINSPFVTAGSAGGDFMFNGGISFLASGPPEIDYFNEDAQFLVDGIGPFVTQNIGTYAVQRLKNMVTLNIRWSVAGIPVTANSDLTLSPVLPVAFRPANNQGFACSVRIAGTNFTLGQCTIDTAGVITIVPSASTTWTIGMTCDFASICASYNILI
jgi:hypothetical protein